MNIFMSVLSKIGGGVGLALSQFMVAYNVLKSFPLFWRVIQNMDQVKLIFVDAKKLLEIIFEKKYPTSDAVQLSLNIVRRSFETGLIDLPNLDEQKFLLDLKEIEENIYRSGILKFEKKLEGEK